MKKPRSKKEKGAYKNGFYVGKNIDGFVNHPDRDGAALHELVDDKGYFLNGLLDGRASSLEEQKRQAEAREPKKTHKEATEITEQNAKRHEEDLEQASETAKDAIERQRLNELKEIRKEPTEIDKIMAELERNKIYEFSASRTVEVLENGEVGYNCEGIHRRIFEDVRHFEAWLACDHHETERTKPVRQYLFNDEKSSIAGQEVWDKQEEEDKTVPERGKREIDR